MANVDIFNMADTWNAIGTTFNGIYMNFTDGAGGAPIGAAASRFLRLDNDGASVFSVASDGTTRTDGTFRFTNSGSDNFISTDSNNLIFGTGSTQYFGVFSNATPAGIYIRSDVPIGWPSANLSGTMDLSLYRDAANTLAQRNGTSAQIFNVYNTFTSSTNKELLAIDWAASANIANIWTVKGSGGGTARALQLGTDATGRWQIGATSGHLLAVADNTYDIGASGATRPRHYFGAGNITTGGDIQVGDGSYFSWNGRTRLTAPVDGNIFIRDSAEASFGLLQFGGTTSSFPALKRSSAILQVRLADDSNFAQIQGTYKHSANVAADAALVSTHSIQIQDAAGNTYKVMLVSV